MLGVSHSPAVTVPFRARCSVSVQGLALPQGLVGHSPLLPSVTQQTEMFIEANKYIKKIEFGILLVLIIISYNCEENVQENGTKHSIKIIKQKAVAVH